MNSPIAAFIGVGLPLLAMFGTVWLLCYGLLRLLTQPVTARWLAFAISASLITAILVAYPAFIMQIRDLDLRSLNDGVRRVNWLPIQLAFSLGYLLALNLVAVPMLYGIDKRRAMSNAEKTRIPEAALHWLAAGGGAAGAWASQHLFRHKVSKSSFQRVFWVTALCSLAIYYWLGKSLWEKPFEDGFFARTFAIYGEMLRDEPVKP